MAHFYGTVQGNRGEGTRCGTKNSGMSTYNAGSAGAIVVRTWYDDTEDCDKFSVYLEPWYYGGATRGLAYGKLDARDHHMLRNVLEQFKRAQEMLNEYIRSTAI